MRKLDMRRTSTVDCFGHIINIVDYFLYNTRLHTCNVHFAGSLVSLILGYFALRCVHLQESDIMRKLDMRRTSTTFACAPACAVVLMSFLVMRDVILVIGICGLVVMVLNCLGDL
jgi:hypothetical protein